MRWIIYLTAELLRSHRWAAPLFLVAGLSTLIWLCTPPTDDTVVLALLPMFPLGAWGGYIAATILDHGQSQIFASAVGSVVWESLAGTVVGTLVIIPLPLLATMVFATLGALSPLTAVAAPIFLAAHTLCGSAAGMAAALLWPSRRGWIISVLVLLSFAETFIPGAVPIRSGIDLLRSDTVSVVNYGVQLASFTTAYALLVGMIVLFTRRRRSP